MLGANGPPQAWGVRRAVRLRLCRSSCPHTGCGRGPGCRRPPARSAS
jgi:hypothetical protein